YSGLNSGGNADSRLHAGLDSADARLGTRKATNTRLHAGLNPRLHAGKATNTRLHAGLNSGGNADPRLHTGLDSTDTRLPRGEAATAWLHSRLNANTWWDSGHSDPGLHARYSNTHAGLAASRRAARIKTESRCRAAHCQSRENP
ncbi:MAG: hypothetical protein CMO74_04620, partial [Verrucomicrobiales bacterium]|nr:hypothetical protein [Verrucomicrobiales bacterium]